MHTALALLLSGLLIAAIEWGVRRGGTWRWTTAWVLGYAAHLACDSPLPVVGSPFYSPFGAITSIVRISPSALSGG